MKRKDYINWDQYFMGVAKLSALRSKDPNTQVGCCIATPDNRIASLGYNGLPYGLSDEDFTWENRDSTQLECKYWYVCHSELNAILNYRGESLKGCRLYVTLFPCNECAKAIIQSGIKEVIYEQNLYPDSMSTKASIKMLTSAGIKLTQYTNKNYQVKFLV